MIKLGTGLPMRNAAGIELVEKRKKPMNCVNLGRREVGGCLPLRGPAHLDQGNMGQLEADGKDKTFWRLFWGSLWPYSVSVIGWTSTVWIQ
jgi:hypothetical protein